MSRFSPPQIDPYRTSKATCEKCGRPLMFVLMDTGRRMPCDPKQVYGDGRRHLVERVTLASGAVVGVLRPKAPEAVLGLEPHWGTCPCRKRKVANVAPTLFDQVAT